MNFKNFQELNIQARFTIISLVFLILGAAIVYGAISVPMAKIKNVRAEILNQKQTMENKALRETNARNLSEKLAVIEPELEKFDQIFINANRELEFITTLENVAARNNIGQKIALNIPSEKSGQSYRKIPLEITAQGNFYDLMRYANDLENLNYYINIKTLDLSRNPGLARFNPSGEINISGQTLNLKLSADTYWR